MTRKDYIAIAEAIGRIHKVYKQSDIAQVAIARVAGAIGAIMADDNSNFDIERFIKACGFEQ